MRITEGSASSASAAAARRNPSAAITGTRAAHTSSCNSKWVKPCRTAPAGRQSAGIGAWARQSGPVQAAVALAYGDDEHVERQRAIYLSRLQLLSDALGPFGVNAPMPDGSFYLWCSKDGFDGWGLAALLAEVSGLIVSPGELYGDDGKDFVRIAVVQPDDRLRLAASRLRKSQ